MGCVFKSSTVQKKILLESKARETAISNPETLWHT